jgi:mycofactocin precursor
MDNALTSAAPVAVAPAQEVLPEEDELVEEDLLVEDVSIDGMCGVY